MALMGDRQLRFNNQIPQHKRQGDREARLLSLLLMKDNLLISKENSDYLVQHNVLEDPNFSAERNNAVINGTIAKYEQTRLKKMKVWDESLRERSEMVASFLKHVNNGKNNNVEKYFGREQMAKLRGEEISNILKGQTSLFKNLKSEHEKTLV